MARRATARRPYRADGLGLLAAAVLALALAPVETRAQGQPAAPAAVAADYTAAVQLVGLMPPQPFDFVQPAMPASFCSDGERRALLAQVTAVDALLKAKIGEAAAYEAQVLDRSEGLKRRGLPNEQAVLELIRAQRYTRHLAYLHAEFRFYTRHAADIPIIDCSKPTLTAPVIKPVKKPPEPPPAKPAVGPARKWLEGPFGVPIPVEEGDADSGFQPQPPPPPKEAEKPADNREIGSAIQPGANGELASLSTEANILQLSKTADAARADWQKAMCRGDGSADSYYLQRWYDSQAPLDSAIADLVSKDPDVVDASIAEHAAHAAYGELDENHARFRADTKEGKDLMAAGQRLEDAWRKAEAKVRDWLGRRGFTFTRPARCETTSTSTEDSQPLITHSLQGLGFTLPAAAKPNPRADSDSGVDPAAPTSAGTPQ